MLRPPTTVRVTRLLLLADSLLWLAFGVYTATGAHPSFGGTSAYRWAMAILALAAAALLAGFLIHLRNPTPTGYWMGTTLLALMVLASVLDQLGFADLVVVAALALPLVLLIRDRSWYLGLAASRARRHSTPP